MYAKPQFEVWYQETNGVFCSEACETSSPDSLAEVERHNGEAESE